MMRIPMHMKASRRASQSLIFRFFSFLFQKRDFRANQPTEAFARFFRTFYSTRRDETRQNRDSGRVGEEWRGRNENWRGGGV